MTIQEAIMESADLKGNFIIEMPYLANIKIKVFGNINHYFMSVWVKGKSPCKKWIPKPKNLLSQEWKPSSYEWN